MLYIQLALALTLLLSTLSVCNAAAEYSALGFISDNNYEETLVLNQTHDSAMLSFTPPAKIHSSDTNLTLFTVNNTGSDVTGKLRYTYYYHEYDILIEVVFSWDLTAAVPVFNGDAGPSPWTAFADDYTGDDKKGFVSPFKLHRMC